MTVEHRYPWLSWQPTMSGRWEREIDEAEQFYTALANNYKASGRMFFAITGFVSLKLNTTNESAQDSASRLKEALRKAWLRLRYDHPTIASRVEFNRHQNKWIKSYTSFDADHVTEQQNEWLEQTFIPIHPGMDGISWCNSDPPAPDMPSLFVIETPDIDASDARSVRRDVVLRSPHDILDGIGTLALLNNLLIHAAQAYENLESLKFPAAGDEIHNLSPALRVAAAIPPILSLAQQEKLQDIIATNTALRKDMRILTLPFKKGEHMPGKHRRVVLHLSPDETDQLLTASKQLGATVTHLYHTAIAITLRDLQAPQQNETVGRYISYSLINERPNCAGDYATPKHAAAVYHSVSEHSLVLDLEIPSIEQAQHRDSTNDHATQAEFASLVEKVKTYYHMIRDSTDHLALAPTMFSLATPDTKQPSSSKEVPAPNSAPSVSLSSMGIVDKIISPQHGSIEVDHPWVTGEELGTGFGMFLGTWKGRLSVSLAYNDAWHDEEEAQGFVERVNQVVWAGLGLDGSGHNSMDD